MPVTVPKNIIHGMPFTWATNYRPRGITTTGQLVIRGGASLLTLGSVVENNHLVFRADADNAADLLPGLYFYQMIATTGGVPEVLESGRFTVQANLALVGPEFDGLSDNQKALMAINKTLAARAQGGAPVRYRINNRELYSESMSDLLALQKHYQLLVNAELAAEAGSDLWNRKIRYSMK